MQTIDKFSAGLKTVPAEVTWYLADIAEAKGKQDLYANQSPQKLKDLQKLEKVVSKGRGVGARWRRKGNSFL